MKAIAITPGKGSPHFVDIPEPEIKNDKQLIVETLQVGICGTDRAEVTGGRAMPPAGKNELIIGHEMLGRVTQVGAQVKSIKEGDLGLFTVRRGCGKCYPCNHNRNDLCETGDYLERGIKGLDGFQAEYIIDDEDYFIKVPDEIKSVGVLVEPMSVVEKAISQALKIQDNRIPDSDIPAWPAGVNVLIAGLGPVGLLAALILKIKGANLFGLDIVDEDSPRAMLIKDLGGTYINGNHIKTKDIDDHYGRFEMLLEATGISKLEFHLFESLNTNGIYIITGIPEGDKSITISGDELIRNLVLNNQVVLGTVNAGIEHYKMAVEDLQTASRKWKNITESIITEKVNFEDYSRAFSFISDEIKTVIEWKQI